VKRFLYIVFLVQLNAFGQNTIATSVSYTKLDFFHGFEYARTIADLDVFAGFEYGMNRTYFQSRFFPKVKVGGYYRALNKEKFNLGPVFQYSYSFLRYSLQPNGMANYHDLSTGVRWRYGKKWQIGQTLLLGGLWERSYNTLFHQKRTSGTLGFVLQIDCAYAF
jgi:hypothetical protein